MVRNLNLPPSPKKSQCPIIETKTVDMDSDIEDSIMSVEDNESPMKINFSNDLDFDLQSEILSMGKEATIPAPKQADFHIPCLDPALSQFLKRKSVDPAPPFVKSTLGTKKLPQKSSPAKPQLPKIQSPKIDKNLKKKTSLDVRSTRKRSDSKTEKEKTNLRPRLNQIDIFQGSKSKKTPSEFTKSLFMDEKTQKSLLQKLKSKSKNDRTDEVLEKIDIAKVENNSSVVKKQSHTKTSEIEAKKPKIEKPKIRKIDFSDEKSKKYHEMVRKASIERKKSETSTETAPKFSKSVENALKSMKTAPKKVSEKSLKRPSEGDLLFQDLKKSKPDETKSLKSSEKLKEIDPNIPKKKKKEEKVKKKKKKKDKHREKITENSASKKTKVVEQEKSEVTLPKSEKSTLLIDVVQEETINAQEVLNVEKLTKNPSSEILPAVPIKVESKSDTKHDQKIEKIESTEKVIKQPSEELIIPLELPISPKPRKRKSSEKSAVSSSASASRKSLRIEKACLDAEKAKTEQEKKDLEQRFLHVWRRKVFLRNSHECLRELLVVVKNREKKKKELMNVYRIVLNKNSTEFIYRDLFSGKTFS